MNAALLQQHLSGNSDALFSILETLEFQHINLNNAKTQFRFSRLEDSNPTSMMLDVNTLRYYCFSTNGKGNLFTLIMDRIHCTFPLIPSMASIVNSYQTVTMILPCPRSRKTHLTLT